MARCGRRNDRRHGEWRRSCVSRHRRPATLREHGEYTHLCGLDHDGRGGFHFPAAVDGGLTCSKLLSLRFSPSCPSQARSHCYCCAVTIMCGFGVWRSPPPSPSSLFPCSCCADSTPRQPAISSRNLTSGFRNHRFTTTWASTALACFWV